MNGVRPALVLAALAVLVGTLGASAASSRTTDLTNPKHFFQNMLLAGATDEVRLVNLSSEVVAPGWRTPIGLLWLDGDHAYEGVRRDFTVWESHLTDDATVAFHDSNAPGVGRLLLELVAAGWRVDAVVGITTVLQR